MLKAAAKYKKGAHIAEISEGSIAEEVGLESGDSILKINGEAPEDIINYRVLSYAEDVDLEIIKKDGEPWFVEIEKEEGEPLGISFKPTTIDAVRTCSNNCIFCFVQQNPPGMRKTVNFRDDDYRLSFLEGNYITLNNIPEKELKRIVANGISPLYVSVHTTDAKLRKKMMKHREAGNVLNKLRFLTENNIHIHGQVVVCPGWNDGEALRKTIADLASLGSAMESLAIVPVGITGYRRKLKALRPPSAEEAKETLSLINEFQQEMIKERESRFVFASDEYYLTAGENVPEEDFYEDYPQLANGVGLLRLFLEDYNEIVRSGTEPGFKNPISVTVATGEAAKDYISEAVDYFNQIHNLTVNLKVVPASFFGGHVTVAGLLTGKDFIDALNGQDKDNTVFFPGIAIKEDEAVFLDGITLEEVEKTLKVSLKPVYCLKEMWNLIKSMGEEIDG